MECLIKVLTCAFETIWNICSCLWNDHSSVLAVILVGVASIVLYKNWKKTSLRTKWNSVGKNVVVLHGFPRSPFCPNISPFVMKVECYLRMAGIQYEYDSQVPIGPKGKSPWITLNGEDIADSEIILKHLAKTFNKNFSAKLTTEQKGVARALQVMCDEHLLWGMPWWRFVKEPHTIFTLVPAMKWSFLRVVFWLGLPKMKAKRFLYAQGLGRHTDTEIIDMMRRDMEAISNYLGNKTFLMGEQPCEADCAVFACLTQYVWALPGCPMEKIIHKDFKNLVAYVNRMKSRIYKDWDQLCK